MKIPSTVEPSARVLVIDDNATVLQVVATILQLHGYEAVVAADGVKGFEALQQDGRFDLILLDFVMPRMNGYQFCRKLRADSTHADLPVVLMSALTSKIADRFVEQTGAVDALGKPFDARALLAVVGGALSRAAEGSVARKLPVADEMQDDVDLAPAPESSASHSYRFDVLNKLAAVIADVAAPALSRLGAKELKRTEAVEKALTKALTVETVAVMATVLEDMDTSPTTGEVLRGELSAVPLAEVLQLMQLQRHTGVLRVQYKRRSMTLFIREGQIDLVQSRGTEEEFRLGRYFVEKGWINKEQLNEILEQEKNSDKLIGQALVEAEHIDAEQLSQALAKQSAELIYELQRWPKGRFALFDEPFNEAANTAGLGLGISNLILEGFRRVDEWRMMEKTINFDDVLMVDPLTLGTLDDTQMGEAEDRILAAINGERTVRQVMVESSVASFDAIQAIYRFLQSRIVRVKKS